MHTPIDRPLPSAGTATADTASTANTACTADASSWGLLRAGAALLALRVEALQEVIACPLVLDVLASSAPGLCGAVRLRGLVIPVLDLCAVLGLAPPPGPRQRVIVLMRHAGRLLGLRADAVQGMARIQATALQALLRGDAADLGIATHAFEVGDEVATVLDASRIAALPGVPMVAAPVPGAANTLAATQSEPVLLFDCAGAPLAIAATAVGATVPDVELRDSALRRGLCLGVFEHHGVDLPVVDLAMLLGLRDAGHATDADRRSPLLVLRTPEGQVGLTMDCVSDIVHVAAQVILRTPALGLAHPALYRGVLTCSDPDGAARPPHLLLDHEALAQHELLAALLRLDCRSGAQAADAKAGAAAVAAVAAGSGVGMGATDVAGANSSGRTMLTYHAGVETVSPLIQVSEIIPLPATLVSTHTAGRATLGVFTHRGTALPLIDLVALLAADRAVPARADAAAQRVLIVEEAGRRIGFMVDGLGTIETARWEGPDASEPAAKFDPAQFARRPPLVELGAAGTRRTLARLDLQQLARSLHAV